MGFVIDVDLLWQYGFVITIVGMIAMAANRRSGASRSWKISNITLILLALIGAAPGELLFMALFRYKWKDRLFAVLIPALSLATGILFFCLFRQVI